MRRWLEAPYFFRPQTAEPTELLGPSREWFRSRGAFSGRFHCAESPAEEDRSSTGDGDSQNADAPVIDRCPGREQQMAHRGESSACRSRSVVRTAGASSPEAPPRALDRGTRRSSPA
jgi:hypothetical protein